MVDGTYTPSGQFIVTIGGDYTMRVWHANHGRLAVLPFTLKHRACRVLVSADSRHAIVSGYVPEIHVFNLSQLYDQSSIDMQRTQLLGEILSNKTIHDRDMLQLSTSEWLDRWRQLSSHELP